MGFKFVVVLASVVGITACSSLQTPRASSTDSVEQMRTELLQAEKGPEVLPIPAQPRVVPPPPVGVTSALIPGLGAPVVKAAEPVRFDLSVNNVPVADFFNGLVAGTTDNVVLHPSVAGAVSLELKQVTVREVMDLMRDMYGYDYSYQGRIYRVFPRQLRTQVFQINYLDVTRQGGSETRVSSGQITASGSSSSGSGSSSNSSGSSGQSSSGSTLVGTSISTRSENDFWSQLGKTLNLIVGTGDGRSVISTPNAGVVVVRAMPEELTAVEDYLRRTELIMQRQVILEAKILEVELSDSYKQGIEWGALESSASLDVNGNPKKFLTVSQARSAITDNFSADTDTGGIFSASVKLGDFTSVIELLGQQGNVQVLSSPRISTVNNQKAVIKVGTDEYFVTDIEISDNNDSATSSTDVDIEPFFSGIALDVTPQISEDGRIILHVHPSISEVTDQQKVISVGDRDLNLPLALSTIRETDSIISARNGQIVVIGGLIQNQVRDVDAAVPLLSDIPLMGELFKQKRQTSRKSELVILLRPIVTGEKVFQNDIEQSRRRFDAFRKILAAPKTVDDESAGQTEAP